MLGVKKPQLSRAKSDLHLARCLYKAIEDGLIDSCSKWLSSGANPNLLLPEGVTPFHLAAGNNAANAVQIVRLCIEYGADANTRSAEGMTPLHVSAIWGKADVLSVLLQHGGDPSLTDGDDENAWDLALEHKQKDVVKVLLEHEKQNDPKLSLSSLTLTQGSILFKKMSERRSLKIPKSKAFSKPICCQRSPNDENTCQNPAENSFRLRRSASDTGIFSRSFPTPWRLDHFISPSRISRSPNASFPSLYELQLERKSSCKQERRSAPVKRLDFDIKSHPIDDRSSVYVTCEGTNLFNSSDFIPSTSSPYSNGLKMTEIVENDDSNDDDDDDDDIELMSPAEILSCDPSTSKKVDILRDTQDTKREILRSFTIRPSSFHCGQENSDELSISSPVVASTDVDRSISVTKLPANESNDFEEFIYVDEDEGVKLIERRHPSIDKSSLLSFVDETEPLSWRTATNDEGDKSADMACVVSDTIERMSNSELRRNLIGRGDEPGPITETTRQVYEMRLARLQQTVELSRNNNLESVVEDESSLLQRNIYDIGWETGNGIVAQSGAGDVRHVRSVAASSQEMERRDREELLQLSFAGSENHAKSSSKGLVVVIATEFLHVFGVDILHRKRKKNETVFTFVRSCFAFKEDEQNRKEEQNE